jgi:hypothetical protein
MILSTLMDGSKRRHAPTTSCETSSVRSPLLAAVRLESPPRCCLCKGVEGSSTPAGVGNSGTRWLSDDSRARPRRLEDPDEGGAVRTRPGGRHSGTLGDVEGATGWGFASEELREMKLTQRQRKRVEGTRVVISGTVHLPTTHLSRNPTHRTPLRPTPASPICPSAITLQSSGARARRRLMTTCQ